MVTPLQTRLQQPDVSALSDAAACDVLSAETKAAKRYVTTGEIAGVLGLFGKMIQIEDIAANVNHACYEPARELLSMFKYLKDGFNTADQNTMAKVTAVLDAFIAGEVIDNTIKDIVLGIGDNPPVLAWPGITPSAVYHARRLMNG